MKEPVKAVLYGVGAMGSLAARLMLEKGVVVVGAVSKNPTKVGRDLGDVAKLGFLTGVTIGDDPRKIFETRSVDIAVVAVEDRLFKRPFSFPMAPRNTTEHDTWRAEHDTWRA